MISDFTIDGKNHRVEIQRRESGWRCLLDGNEINIDAVLLQRDVLSLLIDGKSYEIKRDRGKTETFLRIRGLLYQVESQDQRSFRNRKPGITAKEGRKDLVATRPGKEIRVLVPEMGEVKAGDGVLIVEAMKMQNEVKSPKDGVVVKILSGKGTNVNAGDVLAIVE